MSIEQAAREYADRGWLVFPVPPGEKKSYKSATHSDGRKWGATTEPAEINRDWRQWPDANVGIVTGPKSGIFVVEADTLDGHGVDGIANLEKLIEDNGGIPDTLEAASPSGSRHLYFRYPQDREIKNSTSKVAKGVDVRGDGGMVIGPPSVKPGYKQAYSWKNPPGLVDLAECPEWLVKKCIEDSKRSKVKSLSKRAAAASTRDDQSSRNYAEAALRGEINDLLLTPEGQRNDALNRVAFKLGQLVGGGHIDQGQVVTELSTAAEQIGLDDNEIEPTINSGLQAGMNEPRHPDTQVRPELSKTAHKIGKRISERIDEIVTDWGDDAKAAKPEIDVNRIATIIETSFWCPAKGKMYFMNRDGDLVYFPKADAWRFLSQTFGNPANVEPLIDAMPPMSKEDTRATAGALRGAVTEPIMDQVFLYRQRDALAWEVDMFANAPVFKLREFDAQIVLPHRPWPIGPINHTHVEDFRQHWPEVDDVLKFIIDARFAGDRKKAFLWWQAASDFGKGLFTGLLKDLGVVVETSAREIEKVFEGSPVGLSADSFKRAIVLLVDEFKSVKSEMKQLQNQIELSPKNQLRQSVAVYTKLFTSAESVASLVTTHGVEDQFSNRMSLIVNEGRIDDRDFFASQKAAYADSLRNWIAQTLNRNVEAYRVLGPVNAVAEADKALSAFHERQGISKKLGRVSDALHDIAEKFRADMLDEANYSSDVVELQNGGVGLLRARKKLEDWLEREFDKSERMTFVKKVAAILEKASVDGQVTNRKTIQGKTAWTLLLEDGFI